MIKHLLTAAGILLYSSSFSQGFPAKNYPRGYFRDPLDIPISLAANFGELRPNHYHMGLDIRTQKKVNLPVHAAADGYIAHIKIEPEGFGQAIYINHPNGYTTLYAHLNRFFPALADYVKRQQYKLQSWQVSLDIPPGMFPVKKGELIAYSGSTGGSQGPHLHFEIRRTAGDINLNPLLFGLPVPDDVPPIIERLAFYDRDRSVYDRTPVIYPVRRKGPATPVTSPTSPNAAENPVASPTTPANTFFSIDPGVMTVNFPRISFAISAFDSQTGSTNPNGIYQAVLYDGGRSVSGFQMDQISYEYTRNINAHIDYAVRKKGGPWLQHLSRLPGYDPPSIYGSFRSDTTGGNEDGVIDLRDGAVHSIRIEVQDAYGNSSELHFGVRYVKPTGPSAFASMLDTAVSPGTASGPAPAPPGKSFYPNMLDGLETADCAFYIPEKGLYDLAWIRYSRTNGTAAGPAGRPVQNDASPSPVYTIGDPAIPLQDPLLVRIRTEAWPEGMRDKVVMVRTGGGGMDVERPQWQGGWASAYFREFGSFRLVEDSTRPAILPAFKNGAVLTRASTLSFRVKDNLGAIRSVRAELDPDANGIGQWLCFTNDKGRAFIYTFDEHCPHGRHVLKVRVEDEAGNITTGIYHFTR